MSVHIYFLAGQAVSVLPGPKLKLSATKQPKPGLKHDPGFGLGGKTQGHFEPITLHILDQWFTTCGTCGLLFLLFSHFCFALLKLSKNKWDKSKKGKENKKLLTAYVPIKAISCDEGSLVILRGHKPKRLGHAVLDASNKTSLLLTVPLLCQK